MTHVGVGLVSFAVIFGAALIGLGAARWLPSQHLSKETQSVITVAVAVLGTLSALVLGLMITAANRSFSSRSEEVRELSLQLIRMDRNLKRYGPESAEARSRLQKWAVAKTHQLFPEKGQPEVSSEQTIDLLERVQEALIELTPKDERQKYLGHLCLTLSSTMIEARWALETHSAHSIPVPFLVLLISWLAIVFASFGLFAPSNLTTVGALFLCAVAVAGGIMLIEELDNPRSGLVRLPPDSMKRALTEIGR